jgi:hypothetical protein
MTLAEGAKIGSEIATGAGVLGSAIWTFFIFGIQRKKERHTEQAAAKKDADLRKERQEHQRQALAWRMTLQAKKLNDEMMTDEEAIAALDWIDNGFKELTFKGQKHDTSQRAVLEALKEGSDDVARVLRRCLDAWFYYLVIFQHYLDRHLILLVDIDYPVSYYVRVLKKNAVIFEACKGYIKENEIDKRALTFMNQLDRGT